MNIAHRIQEKLADRFSFIQYPNISPADARTRDASRSGLRFATPMPFGKRLDIFLFSLLLLIVGTVAAALVGLFIYCLL